jgi:hypothetical protein
MTERTKNKSIKQLIQSTVAAVQMDIRLKPDSSGVNMSYNFILDYVGFDTQRLQQARNEMQTHIPLDEYIKILTLHELGHAVDREALMDSLPRTMEIYEMKKKHPFHQQYEDLDLLEMIIEEHKMNILFEETAWLNAEELNRIYRIVDWYSFEKVKTHSLSTYQELYEKDLALYDRLVAESGEPAAS